jgi:hypothetical protein
MTKAFDYKNSVMPQFDTAQLIVRFVFVSLPGGIFCIRDIHNIAHYDFCFYNAKYRIGVNTDSRSKKQELKLSG